jgi:hypothetical protein
MESEFTAKERRLPRFARNDMEAYIDDSHLSQSKTFLITSVWLYLLNRSVFEIPGTLYQSGVLQIRYYARRISTASAFLSKRKYRATI